MIREERVKKIQRIKENDQNKLYKSIIEKNEKLNEFQLKKLKIIEHKKKIQDEIIRKKEKYKEQFQQIFSHKNFSQKTIKIIKQMFPNNAKINQLIQSYYHKDFKKKRAISQNNLFINNKSLISSSRDSFFANQKMLKPSSTKDIFNKTNVSSNFINFNSQHSMYLTSSGDKKNFVSNENSTSNLFKIKNINLKESKENTINKNINDYNEKKDYIEKKNKFNNIEKNNKSNSIEKNNKYNKIEINNKTNNIEKNNKSINIEKNNKINSIEKNNKSISFEINNKSNSIEKNNRSNNIENNQNIEKEGKNNVLNNEKKNDKENNNLNNNNLTKMKKISEEEIRIRINQLRTKLNKDLVELISTEKQKEELREQILNSLKTKQEKKKLEKSFGLERLKVTEKIMKKNDEIEKKIKQYETNLRNGNIY